MKQIYLALPLGFLAFWTAALFTSALLGTTHLSLITACAAAYLTWRHFAAEDDRDLAAALVSAAALCQPANCMQLQLSEIRNFRADTVDGGKYLHITGGDPESAWPIERVIVKKRRHNVYVTVQLRGLFGRGPGKFSLDECIPLTNEIEHVYLGSRHALIWTKPSLSP